MAWPALLKAKDNTKNIASEIDKMLKDGNSLSKKDIVNYRETVLRRIDMSLDLIDDEIKVLRENLLKHRKYFEAKSKFLRRHHKRL